MNIVESGSVWERIEKRPERAGRRVVVLASYGKSVRYRSESSGQVFDVYRVMFLRRYRPVGDSAGAGT